MFLMLLTKIPGCARTGPGTQDGLQALATAVTVISTAPHRDTHPVVCAYVWVLCVRCAHLWKTQGPLPSVLTLTPTSYLQIM